MRLPAPTTLVALSLLLSACPKEAPPEQATPSTSPPPAPPVPPVATLAPGDAFVCPMHPEVKSGEAGKCPTCGMDLVPAAPTGTQVLVTPTSLSAGTPATLTLEALQNGKRVTAFEIVHDKPMHLLMVTPDLSWFAHEHPQRDDDGRFALPFTFPRGGPFLLFADFKPEGGAPQVIRVPVEVAGDAPPAQPLAKDLAPKEISGRSITLAIDRTQAGADGVFTFTMKRGGKPVTNLEPYLGAMGHLVVIHEDATTFLHAHPEDAAGGHAHGDHAAPHAHGKQAGQNQSGAVRFTARFPKAGLYKAWGQFQHEGTLLTAPFVVEVAAAAP